MESDSTSGGKYLCGCFHCSQTQLVSGALHGAVVFPWAEGCLLAETRICLRMAVTFSPHKWGQLLSMSALACSLGSRN